MIVDGHLYDGGATMRQKNNMMCGCLASWDVKQSSRTIKIWRETNMLALSDTPLNDIFKDHVNKLNQYMNSLEKMIIS
jgi:hypothetical protein